MPSKYPLGTREEVPRARLPRSLPQRLCHWGFVPRRSAQVTGELFGSRGVWLLPVWPGVVPDPAEERKVTVGGWGLPLDNYTDSVDKSVWV